MKFMTSGPCMPMVLERDDAVVALREAIGATDPAEAEAREPSGSSTRSRRSGTRSMLPIPTRTRSAKPTFFFPETELMQAR